MSQSPAFPTFIFRGHEAAIHALHFFSNNHYLASGDADGWIVLWSLAVKRPVAVWKGHEGGVMAIQDWADDRLISHGRDHFLRVWQVRAPDLDNLSTKLPVDGATPNESPQPWLLHSMAANALNYCAFSQCNENVHSDESVTDKYKPLLIATPNGLDAGGIDIFQLPSQYRVNKKASDRTVQTGMVMSLSLFQHPKLERLILVAGYESGHVMVFLRESVDTDGWHWTSFKALQPHSQPVLSLDTTPELDKFVSSSADALIAKYNVPQFQTDAVVVDKTVNTKHAGQQDITVRDDGKIFGTAGWDQRVRIYSLKTLKELAVLKWHQEGCYAVAFASTLVKSMAPPSEASETNHVLVKTPIELIKTKRAEQAQQTHWLAAGGKDGKISLWDIY